MRITKLSQLMAVTAVAAFTLAGCGSSSNDAPGIATTAITNDAQAAMVVSVDKNDMVDAEIGSFLMSIPSLPTELDSLAPKSNASKSPADRLAARKAAKATGVTCDTGKGTITPVSSDGLYTYSAVYDNCVVPIANHTLGDSCTLNGTEIWEDKRISAAGDIETWVWTDTLGNGNGIAEASDFVITCSVDGVTNTYTQDEYEKETYTSINAVLPKTIETYVGTSRSAFTVTDADNAAYTATLTGSDNWNDRYSHDNSATPDVYYSGVESGNGRIDIFMSSAVDVVEYDLTANGTWSSSYKTQTVGGVVSSEDTFSDYLNFNDPTNCASGSYLIATVGPLTTVAGDEVGTILVNGGAVKIEFLAANAVKLTVGGVENLDVTTEAQFDDWVASAATATDGTCELVPVM